MRDLLLIGAMVLAAIVIGTLLFLFGPTSLQADVQNALYSVGLSNSGRVSYTVLAQGDALSAPSRTNYRVQTDGDFRSLWMMIYGYKNAPLQPEVDFSKYEVLAIFDGSHTSAGYGITIQSLTDENAERLLVVVHTSPGASCPTAPKNTSPFILIQVPKTTFPLTHSDVLQTSTCS